ncbi:MAG: hypothetical protein M3R02_23105 [Chloroflexota bacterium]|nr:hypothetical protein [Chloroflexota bacterium]
MHDERGPLDYVEEFLPDAEPGQLVSFAADREIASEVTAVRLWDEGLEGGDLPALLEPAVILDLLAEDVGYLLLACGDGVSPPNKERVIRNRGSPPTS